jgi:hypothetical protein
MISKSTRWLLLAAILSILVAVGACEDDPDADLVVPVLFEDPPDTNVTDDTIWIEIPEADL